MLKNFNRRKTWMIPMINCFLRLLYHEKKVNEKINLLAVKSILVIDYALIGDSVMSSSFFRIIKKNLPDVRLTLVCSEFEKAIYEEQDLIDEFITINLNLLTDTLGIIKNNNKVKEIAWKINKHTYDMAIEPRGDLRFIYLMHLCNAKRKISYNYTGGECFLTDVLKPSKDVTHVVEDKLYILKYLGFKFNKDDIYPRLDRAAEDWKYCRDFIKSNALENRFLIGIHPGASLAIRNWMYFPELLKKLNKGIVDACFLIFEGPKEEIVVSAVMEAASEVGASAIRIHKGIRDYIRLLGACDILVCNDSGAGHIGAALSVKTFVVFGPNFPREVRPYSDKGIYCFSYDDLTCKPCRSRECLNKNRYACLYGVKADQVYNKIMEILQIDK